MIEAIKEHLVEVERFNATSQEELETFRIKYLGKKGLLNHFFAEFKNVPKGEKKEFGLMINQLKDAASQKVAQLKEHLENQAGPQGSLNDLSRPGEPVEVGARHPISLVRNRIVDIFSRIGFNVPEGPEIEDDWHNFSALNLP